MTYQLKNIRVLVIANNGPLCSLVKMLLYDLGFGGVDTVPDPELGWEIYTSGQPDIIIVDWRLDKSEGLDFVKRVRTDDASPQPSIPIIVMTGSTNKKQVFHARDSGATEFLTKPFTIQTLTRQLAHIVEKPRDFVKAPKFVGPDRRRRMDPIDASRRKPQKTAAKKSARELHPDKYYVNRGLMGDSYNQKERP